MQIKKKIMSGTILRSTLTDLMDEVELSYTTEDGYGNKFNEEPFCGYFSDNFEDSFAGLSLPSDEQLKKLISNHPEFKKEVNRLLGKIAEQIGTAFCLAEEEYEEQEDQERQDRELEEECAREEEEDRKEAEKEKAEQIKKKEKLLKTFSSEQLSALKEIGVQV